MRFPLSHHEMDGRGVVTGEDQQDSLGKPRRHVGARAARPAICSVRRRRWPAKGRAHSLVALLASLDLEHDQRGNSSVREAVEVGVLSRFAERDQEIGEVVLRTASPRADRSRIHRKCAQIGPAAAALSSSGCAGSRSYTLGWPLAMPWRNISRRSRNRCWMEKAGGSCRIQVVMAAK